MNHYQWLQLHLWTFLANVGVNPDTCRGIISSAGDKCYSYRYKWESKGIPFPHGVAIYFLTYLKPYSSEVRETAGGWIDAGDWVVTNYPKFKEFLPTMDIED